MTPLDSNRLTQNKFNLTQTVLIWLKETSIASSTRDHQESLVRLQLLRLSTDLQVTSTYSWNGQSPTQAPGDLAIGLNEVALICRAQRSRQQGCWVGSQGRCNEASSLWSPWLSRKTLISWFSTNFIAPLIRPWKQTVDPKTRSLLTEGTI